MFDFAQIDEIRLASGVHATPEHGLCFMEMVSWFAGEAHSDQPACACPALGAYSIRLNDAMPDDARDRLLKPLVPMIAGTADKASEQKRAEFLAMWAVNKIVPIALRAAGFKDHALACEQAKTLDEARSTAESAASAATTYAASAYAYADAHAAIAEAVYAAASNAANAAANAAFAAAVYAYASSSAAYANASAASAAALYAASTYAYASSSPAAAPAAASAAAVYAAAVYAANAAESAAAAEKWEIAVEGLRQAILIGRHEGFDVAEAVLIERRAKLPVLA